MGVLAIGTRLSAARMSLPRLIDPVHHGATARSCLHHDRLGRRPSPHQRSEMVSLTDMWKAAGGEERNKPVRWYSTDMGKAFVAFVADNLKSRDTDLWQTRLGRGGGTWAHWQLALAYAKFLSPEFHLAREMCLGGVLVGPFQRRPENADPAAIASAASGRAFRAWQPLSRMRSAGRLCGRFRDVLGVQTVRAVSAVLRSHRRRASSHRFRFSPRLIRFACFRRSALTASGSRIPISSFSAAKTVSVASTFPTFWISDPIPGAAAVILARMLDLKPREAS
jgi:KilA-N domain